MNVFIWTHGAVPPPVLPVSQTSNILMLRNSSSLYLYSLSLSVANTTTHPPRQQPLGSSRPAEEIQWQTTGSIERESRVVVVLLLVTVTLLNPVWRSLISIILNILTEKNISEDKFLIDELLCTHVL